VRDECVVEADRGRRLAQPDRRLQRIDAGIRERTDDPDVLDRRSVDLLDLARHQVEDVRAGQDDGELVDRDPSVVLEHVDGDDVASYRTDARRDEREGAGAVGEPDPDEDVDGRLPGVSRRPVGVRHEIRVGVRRFGRVSDP